MLLGLLLGGMHVWNNPLALGGLFLLTPFYLLMGPKNKAPLSAIFLFHTAYFGVSLYWLPNSFLVFTPNAPLYIMAGCVVLLSLYTALFFWVLSWGTQWYRRAGILKALLFMITWLFADFLRSMGPLGIPASYLGYLWIHCLPIAQSAAWGSLFFLTFLGLVLGLSPLLFLKASKKAAFIYGILICVAFGFLFINGKYKIENAQPPHLPALSLIQPNIPQAEKWDTKHLRANFYHMRHMSMAALHPKTHLLIWPEAALTFSPSPALLKALVPIIPPSGYFLTGYIHSTEEARHNSLLVLNKKGTLAATYHKAHLFPFGEYLPFENYIYPLLPGPLKTIVDTMSMLTHGPGYKVIHLKGMPPFLPLICYEVIFSKALRRFPKGYKWILNLTNDAWFEGTPGPIQHLNITRLRAIEEQKPIVRATNTGISAIISAQGILLKSLPFNTTGTLTYNPS